MGIAITLPPAHFKRGFAHHDYHRRSPQATASAMASASANQESMQAAATPVAMLGTHMSSASFKGMLVIIGGFVVIVLAFAIWKLVSWRRRRAAFMDLIDDKQTGFATKVDLEASFETLEKPHQAVLRPVVAPVSSGVGWVPQIKSELALPEPTKARSERAKKAWEKNLAEFMAPPVPIASHNGAKDLVPIPAMPPMPLSQPQEAMPPTPIYKKFTSEASVAPTAPVAHSPNPISVPVAVGEPRLPRLMDVATAFTPSLDDELSLSLGETIRLVEEYEDQWCLVQRVGRRDAPQGVVPRFCLVERPPIAHKGSLRRGEARSS